MKTTIRTGTGLLLAALIISIYSCDDYYWHCLRGNGIIVTEEREIHDIHGIISEGSYEIEVIIGSETRVEVEWDDNLLPYLRTRVSGEKLIIDQGSHRCLRSDYPARVFVYTPDINLLRLTGSGSVICDNLYTDDLKIEITGSGYIDMRDLDALSVDANITGSGEIILEGVSGESEFTISGSGEFDTKYLVQEICIATISGSGDMEVYASRLLDAVITGSGNIYYYGNPRNVVTHISGSGSVIKMNDK